MAKLTRSGKSQGRNGSEKTKSKAKRKEWEVKINTKSHVQSKCVVKKIYIIREAWIQVPKL
jgi:hypothetical protein